MLVLQKETNLIKELTENGFILKNKSNGNTSQIKQQSRFQAEKVRSIFDEIMKDIANVDILYPEKDIEEAKDPTTEKYFIRIGINSFTGKSKKRVYFKFIKHLANTGSFDRFFSNDNIGVKFPKCFSNKEKIGKTGRLLTEKISDNKFVYTNLSAQGRNYNIQAIQDFLGEKVETNL